MPAEPPETHNDEPLPEERDDGSRNSRDEEDFSYFGTDSTQSCSSEELRTQLANERTYLAWVRTGLALVAFGFLVEKASPFLQQLSPDIAAQESTFIHTSGITGVILMLAGSVVIILATLRFWHTTTQIQHGQFLTSTKLDAAIALTIAIVSLILIIFLIFQSTAFWNG